MDISASKTEPPILESDKRDAAGEGVQTPASKIRHEWYQTADSVVVTLLARGVPKDKATIDIQPHSVCPVSISAQVDSSTDSPFQASISFPMPGSAASTFDFSLDPLFAAVMPDTSTSSIMSTKIELVLKKARSGQKWPSLEGNGERAVAADETLPAIAASPSVAKAVSASAPSYPTSSRTGPKDWDKVASELSKTTRKKEKKDKATDEAVAAAVADAESEEEVVDDEEDEGDPVNGFFKKLYGGADADTRRAMIKSYQESNGTALSTNWAEVGKAPVETSPPEGMEARAWGT